MVFSTEICRVCLNYTDASNKFSDAILELITFLVKSNRFFPRDYISTLVIHENIICDTCIKCLRTAVKLKKSQTASYEHLTVERKRFQLENLSLNRMSMFNDVSYDIFRVCSMCLEVIKDTAVYLYNNSKNLLPPHILRSMLIYCRLHLSSHIINPVMCHGCWEDLQIVYNFKKSSDEVENLMRFYCEANGKRRLNKSDLEIVFRIKQHEAKASEKSKDNYQEIFDKFFNITSPRIKNVIGTVNVSPSSNKEASSITSNIIEKTTEGYCEEQVIEKVPVIRIRNFVGESTATNKPPTNKLLNNSVEKTPSGTSIYSEILNREIFGPVGHIPKPPPKPAKTTNNYLRVSENLFSSDNVASNYIVNKPQINVNESTVKVKQEVISDESDDNNDSQTNLEALVDVEGFEPNDNLYDTDFEMEEVPPPLLEVQEPLITKDVKIKLLQSNKNGFPNEHKVKLDTLFTCDQCDFSTHFALPKRLHVQWHAENKLKLHVCEKCDYKTTRMVALRKHQAMHKQNKKGRRTKSSSLSPSTAISGDQPPLLEAQQPCQPKFGGHIDKDQKSQLLAGSPESQDSRPVIYRMIGTPKHKKVLKIIGYLDNGKKVFGSAAKRGRNGRILTEKEVEEEGQSETKKLRRSNRRINPENLKAHAKLESAIAAQNKDVIKESPAVSKTSSDFYCNQCDFQTATKKSLDSHLAAHKANTLVLHYCVQCDYKTTKKHALKEHHRGHLVEDGLLQVTNKRRGRRPKAEPTLAPPRLRSPGGEEDSCPELDAFHLDTPIDSSRGNNRPSSRRASVGGPPLLEPQQSCNEFILKPCSIQLKRENIDEYLTNVPEWSSPERSEEIFNCDKCNFTTHFKSRMGQHEYAHETNRLQVYTCDKCPYKITNGTLLKLHQKEHRKPRKTKKLLKNTVEAENKSAKKLHRSPEEGYKLVTIPEEVKKLFRDPKEIDKLLRNTDQVERLFRDPKEADKLLRSPKEVERMLRNPKRMVKLLRDTDQYQEPPKNPQEAKELLRKDASGSQLSCHRCNYTTIWAHKMKQHEYGHESNSLTLYSCELCDYTITSKNTFLGHKREHNRDRRIKEGRPLISLEPEMPILSVDDAGTSYENKSALLRLFEENEEFETVSLRLEKHDILYSAAKTHQDQDIDFETGLMEWFEKEILTNKTYGIKLLNQILNEKGQ